MDTEGPAYHMGADRSLADPRRGRATGAFDGLVCFQGRARAGSCPDLDTSMGVFAQHPWSTPSAVTLRLWLRGGGATSCLEGIPPHDAAPMHSGHAGSSSHRLDDKDLHGNVGLAYLF